MVEERVAAGLTPKKALAPVFGAMVDTLAAVVVEFMFDDVAAGGVTEGTDDLVSCLAVILLDGLPAPRFHTAFTIDFVVDSSPNPDFFFSVEIVIRDTF